MRRLVEWTRFITRHPAWSAVGALAGIAAVVLAVATDLFGIGAEPRSSSVSEERPPPVTASTSTLSSKAAACVRLVSALRDEAARVQALHDSIQVDEAASQVTSTYTSSIAVLYEAAYTAASDVSVRISEYINVGGRLPAEYDFEHRTDIMLSTDLPALKTGLIEEPDPSSSPSEAWNELIRYTDFARQVAKTDCGQ